MEIWEVYDKERKKTGRTMRRGDGIAEGDYHLVIHVCVFNSKGEMLIQQRQPFKEGWSNLWDLTAGGSAIQGDTSQAAAERELLEEVGIKVDLTDIRPHFTINFERGFDDIYLVEMEVDTGTLTLQYEEVQAVKWASRQEILAMIESGLFLPYYPSLIDLLFASRRRYGCLQRT